MPLRVFYKVSPNDLFSFCEYQLPYEEYADVYQRVQEMFLSEPAFENFEKLNPSKSI